MIIILHEKTSNNSNYLVLNKVLMIINIIINRIINMNNNIKIIILTKNIMI